MLAVGIEVLARYLHIPAIVFFLPAGFAAGALTSDVNPEQLLGPAFHPFVLLAVAVILYDDSAGLDLRELTGQVRRIVIRLITIGAALTWGLGAAAAALLLGMTRDTAVITGAILIVSGPMVISPLLDLARPTDRLRRVLAWEGSLIDPVGAILAAVVFEAVIAGEQRHFVAQAGEFLASLGLGVAGGAVGAAVIWLMLGRLRLPGTLAANVQLVTVVAMAACCDVIRADSGLIAAVVMGLAVGNLRAFDIPVRGPFFETLAHLVTGVLFVSISATVTPQSVRHLVLPALGVTAVLVGVARPLTALIATAGTDLTWRERRFTGWIAPRGIVAASTASAVAASLTASGVGDAEKVLPVTFVVIVATVVLYGLTEAPVARRLGVVNPIRGRPLLVGGDPWVVEVGRVLRSAGLDVLMWAGSEQERERISQAGLELLPGELLAAATGRDAQLLGITAIFLLTGGSDFNDLAATVLRNDSDADVYSLGPASHSHRAAAAGEALFGAGLTGAVIAGRLAGGAELTTRAGGQAIPDGDDMLFLIRRTGALEPATESSVPVPASGDTAVLLTCSRG